MLGGGGTGAYGPQPSPTNATAGTTNTGGGDGVNTLGSFNPSNASSFYNLTEDEITAGTYNLNIQSGAYALGSAQMTVRVTDGGGLSADHALTVLPTS